MTRLQVGIDRLDVALAEAGAYRTVSLGSLPKSKRETGDQREREIRISEATVPEQLFDRALKEIPGVCAPGGRGALDFVPDGLLEARRERRLDAPIAQRLVEAFL